METPMGADQNIIFSEKNTNTRQTDIMKIFINKNNAQRI